MILVRTSHPCLRVGRYNWYQRITGVIHPVQQYFQKPMVKRHLDTHIRTIVVLTGDKLIEIYFLPLLYTIYYSVMTHLQQGKNMSFLLSGDVNPGPVPSRRGLLEDNPYHTVGVVCLLCDWPRPRT
jgi:hypothetical protein